MKLDSECCYGECRFFIVMLIVSMLNTVMRCVWRLRNKVDCMSLLEKTLSLLNSTGGYVLDHKYWIRMKNKAGNCRKYHLMFHDNLRICQCDDIPLRKSKLRQRLNQAGKIGNLSNFIE